MAMNDSVNIEAVLNAKAVPHECGVSDRDLSIVAAKDSGETSHSFCDSCNQRKDASEMQKHQICAHSVCSACISSHVSSMVEDGAASITCPVLGCAMVLDLEACRGVVVPDVLTQWERLLSEAQIMASEKIYCPYEDCSTLLVNDVKEGVILQTECPVCRRLFCAQCIVPWHYDVGCEEFQMLNGCHNERGDLMIIEFAKNESLKRSDFDRTDAPSKNDLESFSPPEYLFLEEMQLQEALIHSTSKISNKSLLTMESYSITDLQPQEVRVVDSKLLCNAQESLEIPLRSCEICADVKKVEEMFKALDCNHSVCSACIAKHVDIKIKDGAIWPAITCPGLNCPAALELESCIGVVHLDVISRWEGLLFEAQIDESQKFYCPFRECSALLMNDSEEGAISESECPYCRRLFCARCYVPWHSGVECDEFQRLSEQERGREDLMIRELARGQSWNRCPYCKFYVEKTEGCVHITCRCGFEFCYGCGSKWSTTHGGCERGLGN